MRVGGWMCVRDIRAHVCVRVGEYVCVRVCVCPCVCLCVHVSRQLTSTGSVCKIY